MSGISDFDRKKPTNLVEDKFLYLNDKKQGVYVVTQKIQRDANFLNLAKIK